MLWSRWWLPCEAGILKGRVVLRAQISQGRGLPTRMIGGQQIQAQAQAAAVAAVEGGAVLGRGGGGYRPVVKILWTAALDDDWAVRGLGLSEMPPITHTHTDNLDGQQACDILNHKCHGVM